MTMTDAKRAAYFERVAEHIRDYGCHVVCVGGDTKNNSPPFSYSVGIQASCGAPELIVVGLDGELAGALINDYNSQVRDGVTYERGTLYNGFLAGFSVYFEPARPALIADYMLGCKQHYGDRGFKALQLIYPSTAGVWPWQKAAMPAFRQSQPMFGRLRPNRP